MTTKQWLNRAIRLDREIDNLLKVQAMLRERATSITQSYSGDVAQATKDPHKFDALVAINDKIDQQIDKLSLVREEIMDTINRVEDSRYRQILTGRYIAGWTWERIAVEIHYSYKQTTRLHGYALKAVSEYIQEVKHG